MSYSATFCRIKSLIDKPASSAICSNRARSSVVTRKRIGAASRSFSSSSAIARRSSALNVACGSSSANRAARAARACAIGLPFCCARSASVAMREAAGEPPAIMVRGLVILHPADRARSVAWYAGRAPFHSRNAKSHSHSGRTCLAVPAPLALLPCTNRYWC